MNPSCNDVHPSRGPNPGGLVRETFQVSVAGGGGLEPFHAALARKFTDLARRGCHCVIIDRTFVENRYVQAIITPVGARLESVGDFYLTEFDDALEPTDEQRLRELGWIEPGDPDDQDDDTDPALNWWKEITGPGFPADAAALLLTTFVEVHDLIDVEPVNVSVFPAEHQHFEWIDDPDHPCGGHLASTD